MQFEIFFWLFVLALVVGGVPFLLENLYVRHPSCRTWRGGHKWDSAPKHRRKCKNCGEFLYLQRYRS